MPSSDLRGFPVRPIIPNSVVRVLADFFPIPQVQGLCPVWSLICFGDYSPPGFAPNSRLCIDMRRSQTVNRMDAGIAEPIFRLHWALESTYPLHTQTTQATTSSSPSRRIFVSSVFCLLSSFEERLRAWSGVGAGWSTVRLVACLATCLFRPVLIFDAMAGV